jgi:hypothetical protein
VRENGNEGEIGPVTMRWCVVVAQRLRGVMEMGGWWCMGGEMVIGWCLCEV